MPIEKECPNCGATYKDYHGTELFHYGEPKEHHYCDQCGTKLEVVSDTGGESKVWRDDGFEPFGQLGPQEEHVRSFRDAMQR